MRKQLLLLIGLLTVAIGLFAQQGSNPFELPDRIAPTENPAELKIDSSVQSPIIESKAQPDNPFEIKRPTFSKTQKNTVDIVQKPTIQRFKPLSGKFKLWMTILLITILTVLVNAYKTVLAKVYRSFLNDNFLKMVHRDYGTAAMIPYFILYAFSLTLSGVFLFVVFNYYELSFFSSPIVDLLGCVGMVFAIFMIKHLVLQIIGTIFPISKSMEQYSFTIIIFGIIIGLFLLPATLLITYAPPNLTIPLIYGTFIAVGLIYLYRILRSLFIGIKYISLHKFHFFVYLCTIEIAPLLILIKLAVTT